MTRTKTVMVVAGLGQWESILIERMAAQEAPFHRDVFTLPDIMNGVIGLKGVTAHALAALLRGKPFECRRITRGHGTVWHWSWRNHEFWKWATERQRSQYVENGAVPEIDIARSDEVPHAIKAMAAGYEPDEETPCDLV